MSQLKQTDSNQLSDALKDVQSIVKSTANKAIKEKIFNIIVEINFINNKGYAGFHYVMATGDNEYRINLVVPSEIQKELSVNCTYEVSGAFEVASIPDNGTFQFRVNSAVRLGGSRTIESKKQAASEIVEKGYLNKYKNDFSHLKNKAKVKVAIVTSIQSKVLDDIKHVFVKRSDISFDTIPVKLNDDNSIAEGISKASNDKYDVILLVRGGGSADQFIVFDSPIVVKAIFESKVPIITGLGHSENLNFADKVADRAETTPTKAAMFLVEVIGTSITQSSQKAFVPYNKKTYVNKDNESPENKMPILVGVGIAVLVMIILILR